MLDATSPAAADPGPLTKRTAAASLASPPQLSKVRRGGFVPTAQWEAADRADRYELLVRSTLDHMKRPAPFAHESAAVLLGLPIIGSWPDRVHVLERTATGGRGSSLITRHGTLLEPQVVTAKGLLVTSAARTVTDMARTRSLASALASADHALRTGLTTREELVAELAAVRRVHGARRARLVARYADRRGESVGESLSRARMIELGMPMPLLQQEIRDGEGLIGRVDFWWPELGIVGEFDGRMKYGREQGQDVGAVVWQEKVREDRLRRVVAGVVRWTWQEALDLGVFRQRMQAAGLV